MKSRKRLRRGIGKALVDPAAQEHEELKEKLRSRDLQSRKRKKLSDEPDQPPIMRLKRSGHSGAAGEVFHIHNPSSYNRLVNRLDESQANKVPKPDGKLLESPWICALCGSDGYVNSLGGLFGPYYQRLNSDTFWPPFVIQTSPPRKGAKPTGKGRGFSGSSRDQVYTDLWFHGDCLFWASGLLLRGSHITGIEEHIQEYWNQCCVFCGKWGASVACAKKGCSKTFHFNCGIMKGCLFQEHNFTSWCAAHKKNIPSENE